MFSNSACEDWRLLTAGELQRADLVQQFGVSMVQASVDIQLFLGTHPDAIAYDKSRKRYVPANGKYRSQRGWTPSTLRAMRVLAQRGQRIGWR